jgi:GT2 family glycosyltransferase
VTVTGFASVTVAYGSAAVIGDVVDALASVPGCREVVVVDNGTDGSGDVAEGRGASVIRRPDNPGFGAAVNAAVAATGGDVVLVANPDATVDPDGIAAGLAYLSEHPSVAMVQGVIRNRQTGEPERSMGDELGPTHLWGRALGLRGLLGTAVGARLARTAGVADHVDRVPDGPRVVESLAATAVLVRRRAFVEVGGFDPDYFLYGEDLDLCHRLRRAGWDLVALPVPWADHESGGSATSAWCRELDWWQGTMRFARRWWSRPAWRSAQAAAFIRWLRLAIRRPSGARAAWHAILKDPPGA